MRAPLRLSPWLCLLAFGCGDELGVSMTAEPADGIAPLTVRLTASPLPLETAEARYRFDLDGDGTFDTDPSSDPQIEHEYAAAGAVQARVEISDGKHTAIASVAISVRENQPPVVKLDVSPLTGRQPLEVTLDASASVDPDGEPNPLESRFDFDGDGTFDTEFAPVGPTPHAYSVAGTFTPKVEVRDWRGGVGQGSGPALTILPGPDLDVDTDRDGTITDADDALEDAFSPAGGAIFLANVDDDDGDGAQDWRDSVVSGLEDMADLAPLTIGAYPDLPERRHGDALGGAGAGHAARVHRDRRRADGAAGADRLRGEHRPVPGGGRRGPPVRRGHQQRGWRTGTARWSSRSPSRGQARSRRRTR